MKDQSDITMLYSFIALILIMPNVRIINLSGELLPLHRYCSSGVAVLYTYDSYLKSMNIFICFILNMASRLDAQDSDNSVLNTSQGAAVRGAPNHTHINEQNTQSSLFFVI